MADYTHLMNLIQGEVMRIRERRPLEEQEDLLGDLIRFLSGQSIEVTVVRMKVGQERRALLEPDDEAPSESAVEEQDGK